MTVPAAATSALARGTPRIYRPPAPQPRKRQLGLIGLVRALRRNPLECWTEEHFEKLLVAGGLPLAHVLVVNDPRAIRRVLLDNAGNYQKDTLQRRVLSAGLGEGLLSAEGNRWRAQRRTLAPLFARRTVTGFAPAMMAAAHALIERWQHEEGMVSDVAAEMSRVTLDVLQRTIFSEGLGRDPEEFRTAMATYFDTIGKIGPLDVLGVPNFIPRASQFRVRPTLRFFESAIDEIIANRRQHLLDHSIDPPKDILTHLLGAADPETGACMTEAEIRSNILTFIAAGHETTANALSWSIYLLSQCPEWRQRVEAEAERELESESLDDVSERLSDTRAVIEEALRLYPPIAAISRVANGSDSLGGTSIKRGSIVVISPYVLHRHRLLWDRPDVFDPTRFIGSARMKINRFAYLPFGAGLRTCIGSSFALQEATIVLATIVKYFNLEVAAGYLATPLLRVTLRPAGGLPMKVSPRKSPSPGRIYK